MLETWKEARFSQDDLSEDDLESLTIMRGHTLGLRWWVKRQHHFVLQAELTKQNLPEKRDDRGSDTLPDWFQIREVTPRQVSTVTYL